MQFHVVRWFLLRIAAELVPDESEAPEEKNPIVNIQYSQSSVSHRMWISYHILLDSFQSVQFHVERWYGGFLLRELVPDESEAPEEKTPLAKIQIVFTMCCFTQNVDLLPHFAR